MTPAKKAVRKAAPARKAVPAKRGAVAKKVAAPAKRAPAKKTPTAKKALVAKKTPVKKTPAKAPVKTVKKPAVAKKAAPVKKAAPAKKPTAVAKSAPAKKAPAAVKKPAAPAPAKKAAAVEATAVKKAPSAPAVPAKVKPPAPKPVPRPYANDAKFLEEQRLLLLEERTVYQRQAEDLRAEAESLALEREPGDVQFDEESGEGGTIAVDRERDLTLSAQALATIEEIDRALAAIEQKTYGSCDNCAQPIPKARLRALPYARLDVSCKSGGLHRR